MEIANCSTSFCNFMINTNLINYENKQKVLEGLSSLPFTQNFFAYRIVGNHPDVFSLSVFREKN